MKSIMGWPGNVARTGDEKVIQNVGRKTKEETNREDLVVDVRIILECTSEERGDDVDWIHQWDQWRALVNTVMSLRVP
jgi:hypothetical protein